MRTFNPQTYRERLIEHDAFYAGVDFAHGLKPPGFTAANDNGSKTTSAPDPRFAKATAFNSNKVTAPVTEDRWTSGAGDAAVRISGEVIAELKKALTKFPGRQNSAHEGYAVLLEEVDELWDEIKADRGRMAPARKEAIQVAAMAIRYVLELDPH